MIILATTIVICITAVTIVAMACSNKRYMARDETITKELINSDIVGRIMGEKKDVQ